MNSESRPVWQDRTLVCKYCGHTVVLGPSSRPISLYVINTRRTEHKKHEYTEFTFVCDECDQEGLSFEATITSQISGN